MLDQLFNSIGGDVLNNLTEKAGISMDQAKAVLPIGQETLQEGLMAQVKSGNVSGILSMFNADTLQSNPLFNQLKGMLLSKVIGQLGLSEGIAETVAGTGMNSIVQSIAGMVGGSGNVTEDSLKEGLGLKGGLMDVAGGLLKGKLGNIAGGFFGK